MCIAPGCIVGKAFPLGGNCSRQTTYHSESISCSLLQGVCCTQRAGPVQCVCSAVVVRTRPGMPAWLQGDCTGRITASVEQLHITALAWA
jgi:hypothetical protein